MFNLVFLKILLIFDLNQTLFYAANIKSAVRKLDVFRKKKPNDTYNDLQIYFRGGRNEFLDGLFRKVSIPNILNQIKLNK